MPAAARAGRSGWPSGLAARQAVASALAREEAALTDSEQGRGDAPEPGNDPNGEQLRSGFVARFLAQPSNRFAVLFLAYLGVIGLVYPAVRSYLQPLLTGLETTTAWIVAWLLSAFPDKVVLGDTNVNFGGFPLDIIEECTGVYEMMMLSAAILAHPHSWGRKLQGLAIGIPAIYGLNVIRIAGLLVVGRYYPGAFEFFHVYFWQVTMVIMVTLVLLLWLWLVGLETDPAPPG